MFPYEYMSDFEKFKEELPSKGKFYRSADELEKLRNNTLKNYKLFPSHYLSAPSLSWDAMLKVTKTELGLIPDPNMYIMCEKDTSGRIFLYF